MKLKEYKSIEFLTCYYDVESINELVYMFSFLLGMSDSFDQATIDDMQGFLGILRNFRAILEAELNEEEDAL